MNEYPIHCLAFRKHNGSRQLNRWLSCSMLIFLTQKALLQPSVPTSSAHLASHRPEKIPAGGCVPLPRQPSASSSPCTACGCSRAPGKGQSVILFLPKIMFLPGKLPPRVLICVCAGSPAASSAVSHQSLGCGGEARAAPHNSWGPCRIEASELSLRG